MNRRDFLALAGATSATAFIPTALQAQEDGNAKLRCYRFLDGRTQLYKLLNSHLPKDAPHIVAFHGFGGDTTQVEACITDQAHVLAPSAYGSRIKDGKIQGDSWKYRGNVLAYARDVAELSSYVWQSDDTSQPRETEVIPTGISAGVAPALMYALAAKKYSNISVKKAVGISAVGPFIAPYTNTLTKKQAKGMQIFNGGGLRGRTGKFGRRFRRLLQKIAYRKVNNTASNPSAAVDELLTFMCPADVSYLKSNRKLRAMLENEFNGYNPTNWLHAGKAIHSVQMLSRWGVSVSQLPDVEYELICGDQDAAHSKILAQQLQNSRHRVSVTTMKGGHFFMMEHTRAVTAKVLMSSDTDEQVAM